MNEPTVFENLDALDTESKYVVHKAKEAIAHAYAPYSKFLVGAALLLEDGSFIQGSNQENASYPLCMCAERVALYTWAMHASDKPIVKLAVLAHKKNHKELSSASCCGACRQVILEFEHRQQKPIEVLMMTPDHQWVKYPSAAALLPHGFTGDSLL